MERDRTHRSRHARDLRGSQLPRLASRAHKKAALELEHPGLPPQAARQPQRRGAERACDREKMKSFLKARVQREIHTIKTAPGASESGSVSCRTNLLLVVSCLV